MFQNINESFTRFLEIKTENNEDYSTLMTDLYLQKNHNKRT